MIRKIIKKAEFVMMRICFCVRMLTPAQPAIKCAGGLQDKGRKIRAHFMVYVRAFVRRGHVSLF
jgi:hypothetical protein